jgi:hypothetical protein
MSVSRRDFIALLGTSVAAAAAVSAAGKPSTLSGATTSTGASASTAGSDWIVEQIGAVSKGAVPITLRNASSGEHLLVEACRKGASLPAVASSRHFDLFLANNGRGQAQTPVHHVAAARALGAHLDRHVEAVPATVMTMDSRQAAHGELHRVNDDHVAA